MSRTLSSQRKRIRRRLDAEDLRQGGTAPDRQDLGNIRRYGKEIKDILNKQERQIDTARQLLTSILRLARGEGARGER